MSEEQKDARQQSEELTRGGLATIERPLEGLKPPRWLVLVGVALVILAYATWIGGPQAPRNDGYGYLGLARSLAAGEGYLFNGRPHTTFPPGMAAVLSVVFATVGENFFVFHGIVALFGLGALLFIYLGLKRITDPTTALVVTLVTGVAYRFYSYSGEILTDVPTTMLLWVTLYMCLRGLRGRAAWLVFAAAMAGVVVLFRMAGVLMMGALGVGLLLDTSLGGSWRRRLWACAAVVVPAVIVAVIFYATVSHVGDDLLYEDQFSEALGVHENPVVAYVMRLGAMGADMPRLLSNVTIAQRFREGGAVVGLFIVLGMVISAARRRGLAPAMCLLYPMGLGLTVYTEIAVRSRMWLPIQPLLLLLTFQGLAAVCVVVAKLFRRAGEDFDRRLASRAILILAIAIAATNIPRAAKHAGWNIYYPLTGRQDTRIEPEEQSLIAMSERAGALAGRESRVMVGDSCDVARMYYFSGRLTVQWPETEDATPEAAEMIHRHAKEDAQISTVLVPLDKDISRDLAPEIRGAFDGDQDWRLIEEDEFYAMYHRDEAALDTDSDSAESDEVEPPAGPDT